jgi:hypothetical protein
VAAQYYAIANVTPGLHLSAIMQANPRPAGIFDTPSE